MFGSSQQQPTQNTSLFGQPQQQQAAPPSFSFGTPANPLNTSQQAPKPLFGQPANTSSTGPSLFGASVTNSNAPTFGVGNPAQSNTPASNSLFGQLNNASNSLFGSAMAAPSAPAQNPQQAQITFATKYSELPDQTKKDLNEIEKFIQSQISASKALDNRNLEEELVKVVDETEEIQRV